MNNIAVAGTYKCVLHLICALIKAVDEENYLKTVHGQTYLDYMARTGRLLPRL